MIFGGVPIRVARPPRIVPNDKGISTKLGRFDSEMATGISSAKAPTLFIKPESKAAIPVSMAMNSRGRSETLSSGLAKRSMTPLSFIAAEIINTKTTVTTAPCENPVNASLDGTMPKTTATTSALSATTSYRIRPQTKKIIARAKMANIMV